MTEHDLIDGFASSPDEGERRAVPRDPVEVLRREAAVKDSILLSLAERVYVQSQTLSQMAERKHDVAKKKNEAITVRDAVNRIRGELHTVTKGMSKEQCIDVYEEVQCDLEGMIEAAKDELEEDSDAAADS